MMFPGSGPSRRRFVQLAGSAAALTAVPTLTFPEAAVARAATAPGTDEVADTYYRVLLDHTRWSETQWDAARGFYTDKDFGFAVVLGHAVLLTRGTYDAERAGVDRETLRKRTLATIKQFAATNRLTGGGVWGKKLFFDTTFQSYFVLAARLLWADLDDQVRADIDAITREQAAFTTELGTADDPASGDWTPHGGTGGFVGDTKLEEMGVYAQSLAPALAWASDDPRHGDWSDAFGRWSRNEAGLPAADLANPARVDGVPVAANTAQNLYDTFIVENHGSFGPHYQEELWRTAGRNAVHFLLAGRELPQVLTDQPNAGPLWRTLLTVMSDAGEPLMPMVADREHLYGRDVIPLAFLAQVLGDRSAAACELALARRLEAYQQYPPTHRIAKFSGEPKYEPEARAEVAISYLFHEWRSRSGRPAVQPLTQQELFERAGGAVDFGAGPGLVAHQTRRAWAGAVSKAGFVKFAWQPDHDDWLFALSGSTPVFLPSTAAKVIGRSVVTYEKGRDGFEASASLFTLADAGYAGFATLPSGAVVYATTGTGPGEGVVKVHNLDMPGMPGLTGRRTFRTAGGAADVTPTQDEGGPRVDELTFPRSRVRHVRMLGVRPDPAYGYSLYAFEVRAGADGTDLARGAACAASSSDTGKEPTRAVDGDAATRWAVSRADRPRADSWIAVDLGAEQDVDRVTLSWESAAGRAFRVQGSTDGRTWTDLVVWPRPVLTATGDWLDVDGRAGFVLRRGAGDTRATNPLSVYGNTVILSDGGPEPLLVEGHPGASAKELGDLAARSTPTTDAPQVRAALVDGHLTLFNLSDAPVTTRVRVPQGATARGTTSEGAATVLFEGAQTVRDEGTELTVRLEAAQAVVLPPRMTLTAARLPQGLRAEVVDAATVRLGGAAGRVTVTAQGRSRQAVVHAGRTTTVTVPRAVRFPVADLALGRTTFPTAPRPAGMSDPAVLVDGDPATAWTPGPDGRMVVDLGAVRPIADVRVAWLTGHVPDWYAEFSEDGRTYRRGPRPTRQSSVRLDGTARYVAVGVRGWSRTDARPSAVTVTPGS